MGQVPPSRPFKVEDDPARVVVKITEIRDDEIRYTLAVCQALLKRLKVVIEPRYLYHSYFTVGETDTERLNNLLKATGLLSSEAKILFNSGPPASEPAFLETQPGSPRGGHNHILRPGLLHPGAKKMDNSGQLTQAQGPGPTSLPRAPGVCHAPPFLGLLRALRPLVRFSVLFLSALPSPGPTVDDSDDSFFALRLYVGYNASLLGS